MHVFIKIYIAKDVLIPGQKIRPFYIQYPGRNRKSAKAGHSADSPAGYFITLTRKKDEKQQYAVVCYEEKS